VRNFEFFAHFSDIIYQMVFQNMKWISINCIFYGLHFMLSKVNVTLWKNIQLPLLLPLFLLL